MRKVFKIFLIFLITLLAIILFLFFFPFYKKVEKITWGVNFSQKHALLLNSDWKENYLSILDDLKINNIKILTSWDLLEPEKDNFQFQDLKWQIEEAQKRNVNLIVVIGMKTGRWPECHLPDYAKNLPKEKLQERILILLEKIVKEFKNYQNIIAWQVENEPFFNFGECPFIKDENFLKKEVNLVKNLDPKRPIIISDSGEDSFWVKAAKIADILSITMYRKVWLSEFNIPFTYPLTPNFYYLKEKFIEKIFHKKVICGELQAEPWGKNLLYSLPLEEQKRLMPFEEFQKIISFAKKTNFDTFYLWGAEWWYYMKKNNQVEYWQEIKSLIYESRK